MEETRQEESRQPLLSSARVVVEYESVQQVTLSLPAAAAGVGAEVESPETDPKSINIDEPAPTSYVCLGYTFSIIAGFCFTFW